MCFFQFCNLRFFTVEQTVLLNLLHFEQRRGVETRQLLYDFPGKYHSFVRSDRGNIDGADNAHFVICQFFIVYV